MRSPKVEYTIKDLKRKREYAFRCEFDFTSVSLEEIDTVVDYIEDLENNCISKETLRKIKANTDTYRDFTEEVLKLL